MLNLLHESESRDTSLEIINAIYRVSGEDAALFERLWAEPSVEESNSIIRQAWQLCDSSTAKLFWGTETIRN